MKKRPTSVTVIAWILLFTSGLSLLTSTMAINNPKAQELMAKSPIPVPLQYLMLYLGLAIEILSANFMLQAANWARLLYIGWSGIEFLVLLLTSPVKPMLIPRNTNVCGLRLLSLTSEGNSIFYTFCQCPKRLRISLADPR